MPLPHTFPSIQICPNPNSTANQRPINPTTDIPEVGASPHRRPIGPCFSPRPPLRGGIGSFSKIPPRSLRNPLAPLLVERGAVVTADFCNLKVIGSRVPCDVVFAPVSFQVWSFSFLDGWGFSACVFLAVMTRSTLIHKRGRDRLVSFFPEYSVFWEDRAAAIRSRRVFLSYSRADLIAAAAFDGFPPKSFRASLYRVIRR